MISIRPPVFVLTLLALSIACNLPLQPAVPPSATPATDVTGTSAAQPDVAPTVAPSRPPDTPTVASAASPGAPSGEATPSGPPAEAILLLSPGVGSSVVNPAVVAGEAEPVFENTLLVAVLDETGATIGSGVITIAAQDIGLRGTFQAEVPFTPPAAPMAGRIVIWNESARDGHIQHLASVEVTLQPEGATAQSVPGQPHPEAIALREPALLAAVSGGSLRVAGRSAPTFEQNLVVEVRDEGGQLIGEGFATIEAEAGRPGLFRAEVAYAVPGEQRGSVCVSARSPRDGGLVHVSCVEVNLLP